MVVNDGRVTSRYGNFFYLQFSLCFHSPDWWVDIGANIHMCAEFPAFFLLGRQRFLLADGERFACSCSWCWYGHSGVYFKKDRAAEEHVACPLNKEEYS